MPELPDVETFRRTLERHALGRPIAEVSVDEPRLLEGVDEDGLRQALVGHRLGETARHGKYLFARIDPDGPWLVLHFGMTGDLRPLAADEAPPAHTRFRLRFQDGGQLAYVDTRKLGRISLTDSVERFVAEKGLGPDALALDWPTFHRLARAHRGMVKPWLMDQSQLAGIGNIYSDEILFQAGIHPKRPLQDLSEEDLRRLYHALRETLSHAIGAHADPARMPAHFLIPQRHAGGRCPRCGTPLAHSKIGGRTSWYCPRCQPLEPTR